MQHSSRGRWPHRSWRRVGLTATALLALPAAALAHAVVYPKRSAPGAYEKYVLRVPNERAVATTAVEISFPEAIRVVSFADVTGWTLRVLTDSAERVTGAVWTGTLPPQRFVEFPFVAVNPEGPETIRWPAYQTYADGERMEWTGPEDSKQPASTTEIGATLDGGPRAGAALWIALGAAVMALVILGLSLRRAA